MSTVVVEDRDYRNPSLIMHLYMTVTVLQKCFIFLGCLLCNPFRLSFSISTHRDGFFQKCQHSTRNALVFIKKFFFLDFVGLEPSGSWSSCRRESNELVGYITGPYWDGPVVYQKKKRLWVGGPQSPFSTSSSFILFFVSLPSFLYLFLFHSLLRLTSFLYLFLFLSLFRLTSFLSQNKNQEIFFFFNNSLKTMRSILEKCKLS